MLLLLRRRKTGRKEKEVKGERKGKREESGRKGTCPPAVMFIMLWAMWSRRPSLGLRNTALCELHICMEENRHKQFIQPKIQMMSLFNEIHFYI